MRSQESKKILVRGTNWLGDAVMTIPALHRLRSSFPTAKIVLLAPPRAAEVFTGFPLLDEIIVYQRKEQGPWAFVTTLQRLRKEKFDLAILFQNAFEAALLAKLSRAKIRVGYDNQGRGFLLSHPLKRSAVPRNRHQTNDYLDLVQAAEKACFGASSIVTSDNLPTLKISDTQKLAAAKLLAQHGIEPGRQPLIALNAGATNSRAKCWPEERFAALADHLLADRNAQVILLGAPAEQSSAARVMALMRQDGKAINLVGQTSITELIGILAGCDLVVTNDTGPAHVAAALGIPTLTIFGPTNEYETAPLGLRAELMRAEGIECARCLHRECPIDHRCMTRITVDEITEKAYSLMREL